MFVETRRQPPQWRHTISLSAKKIKTRISAEKVMLLDHKGIILIEYLAQV